MTIIHIFDLYFKLFLFQTRNSIEKTQKKSTRRLNIYKRIETRIYAIYVFDPSSAGRRDPRRKEHDTQTRAQ